MSADETAGESFSAIDQAACAFYQRNGYVVVRRLVSPAQCHAVREAFVREVHGSREPILRQTTMRYERHAFDAHGFMMNPIFNVQDLRTRDFPTFKARALDLLTAAPVAAGAAALLGARPTLIQTMFFEGNPETWAHQDSYYQDSEDLGGAVAGWFALEDIQPGAGRFYVYAGSHRMPVVRNAGDFDLAFHHERYKEHVRAEVARLGFRMCAPALQKGDVLFWNSLTVHGSEASGEAASSRLSLTAHYLREGARMLQFHARYKALRLRPHNGVQVNYLHDQDRAAARLGRALAIHFPGPFHWARRTAIKGLTTLSAARARTRAPAPPLGEAQTLGPDRI